MLKRASAARPRQVSQMQRCAPVASAAAAQALAAGSDSDRLRQDSQMQRCAHRASAGAAQASSAGRDRAFNLRKQEHGQISQQDAAQASKQKETWPRTWQPKRRASYSLPSAWPEMLLHTMHPASQECWSCERAALGLEGATVSACALLVLRVDRMLGVYCSSSVGARLLGNTPLAGQQGAAHMVLQYCRQPMVVCHLTQHDLTCQR